MDMFKKNIGKMYQHAHISWQTVGKLNAATVCMMHTWKHIYTCTYRWMVSKNVQFKLESIDTWAEDVLTFKVQ